MPIFTGTGIIERRGDADWFAVQLTGGQAYTVGSNAAGFLQVVVFSPISEAIRPLTAQPGGYSFVAPYSGRFFVEAGSLIGTGAYTLTLTSGIPDGIPGNSWTNVSLPVGTPFTPAVVAGAIRDADWYAVDLMGGQSYNASTTSGFLYIADATGKAIEIDGGMNAHFSPLFGGRYYVAVENAAAGYSVRIDAVADDYADNITTVGRIVPGTAAGGSIGVAGDEDWFQVQLDATRTYKFTTTGVGVSVFDAAGNLLGQDLQYFQAQRTGTYYIEAHANGGGLGPYSVAIDPVTGGILGNIFTDQRLVPTDSPRGAQLLGRGDEDWYRLSLVGGQSYTLATGDGGVVIHLYDAGGNPVFGMPSGNIRSFTPAGTGTYYLGFGTTNTTPTTYFTAVDPYADDYAANFIGAGRINPDTLVTANFEAHDDRDWFAVDLRSNVSYYIDTNASTVRLLDANFRTVATGAGVAFTSQFNGLYYVETVTGAQTGAYTVAVRSFADDYVDNVTTRGQLIDGGATTPPGNGGTTPGGGSTAPTTLPGTAGPDALTSASGSSILIGLGGDDTYTVTSTQVLLIEAPNEGNDVAVVTLGGSNFVLNGNSSVETLRAAPGTDPINITGSPSAQTIIGNDGKNILSSGSAVGDTLAGGLGDDTYRVFGGLDTIVEAAGQGNDSVFVSGNSFALNPGASIEYISVSVQADTGNFYLVGNEVSQVLAGNYGDNILDGNAGTTGNADTLIGLFGNDVYRVYGQNDMIQEAAGQGIDSVYTSGDYQLRNGISIEIVSAENQSSNAPTAQYVLRGNEIGQTMIGNDAANTIDGRGGSDVLLGRGGADVFAFTTAPGAGNVDTILDFVSGTDRIGLASDVFTGIPGGVTAGNFVLGTSAVDADSRIFYDQATGRLFYDADGSGAGATILFAQLGANTVLVSADFLIVAPVADLV